MNSYTLDVSVTLVTLECSNCGIVFALTQDFNKRRHNDHNAFFCPSGHSQFFPQESELEKLRERLRATEASHVHVRDQLESTSRSLTAQKGVTTKLKKRIANGVCPCCNRSFQNVARHMAGQHPDYTEE